MPELPGSGCVVADVPAEAASVGDAVIGEVPEIAASAVLVPSEELPVGSNVVKVRIGISLQRFSSGSESGTKDHLIYSKKLPLLVYKSNQVFYDSTL